MWPAATSTSAATAPTVTTFAAPNIASQSVIESAVHSDQSTQRVAQVAKVATPRPKSQVRRRAAAWRAAPPRASRAAVMTTRAPSRPQKAMSVAVKSGVPMIQNQA